MSKKGKKVHKGVQFLKEMADPLPKGKKKDRNANHRRPGGGGGGWGKEVIYFIKGEQKANLSLLVHLREKRKGATNFKLIIEKKERENCLQLFLRGGGPEAKILLTEGKEKG